MFSASRDTHTHTRTHTEKERERCSLIMSVFVLSPDLVRGTHVMASPVYHWYHIIDPSSYYCPSYQMCLPRTFVIRKRHLARDLLWFVYLLQLVTVVCLCAVMIAILHYRSHSNSRELQSTCKFCSWSELNWANPSFSTSQNTCMHRYRSRWLLSRPVICTTVTYYVEQRLCVQ